MRVLRHGTKNAAQSKIACNTDRVNNVQQDERRQETSDKNILYDFFFTYIWFFDNFFLLGIHSILAWLFEQFIRLLLLLLFFILLFASILICCSFIIYNIFALLMHTETYTTQPHTGIRIWMCEVDYVCECVIKQQH